MMQDLRVLPAVDQEHRRIVAPHFDASYYEQAYPDRSHRDLEPLDHFMLHGWRQDRDPSRSFCTAYYLATHPDIAAAGINPFLHYLIAGASEGRKPRRPLDALRRSVEGSKPPGERARDWPIFKPSHGAEASEWTFRDAIDGVGDSRPLVVSISHDDYVFNYGGIQNLVADERAAFATLGYRYLHLSPASPLPILAPLVPGAAFLVSPRLDGLALPAVSIEAVGAHIARLKEEGVPIEIVIHHVMGFAPEHLAEFCERAGEQPIVWAHDFFFACPSYALMRNDSVFCGGPPPGSPACGVCVYGGDRNSHVGRIETFFDTMRATVLAPSSLALDLWQSVTRLRPAAAYVQPPARVVMCPADDPDARPERAGRNMLRVAHVGARAVLKGWHVFEDLALSLAGDDRYRFYHLGVGNSALPGCIEAVPVQVSAENREAMIEAIAEHRIDVVINWSLWPETFCFAVHEALVGGAFVLARSGAGNVWPAVAAIAPEQGCRVQNEADLAALFADGRIIDLVEASTRTRGVLFNDGGTAAFLSHHRQTFTVLDHADG